MRTSRAEYQISVKCTAAARSACRSHVNQNQNIRIGALGSKKKARQDRQNVSLLDGIDSRSKSRLWDAPERGRCPIYIHNEGAFRGRLGPGPGDGRGDPRPWPNRLLTIHWVFPISRNVRIITRRENEVGSGSFGATWRNARFSGSLFICLFVYLFFMSDRPSPIYSSSQVGTHTQNTQS